MRNRANEFVGACLCAVFAWCLTGPVHAQGDPQGLSANLPVRLKDAFVTPSGHVALQTAERVSIAGDGRYSARGGPAIKLGLPGRIELSFAPVRQFGDASSVHGNLAGAEVEWNFRQQGRYVPAMLISLIRQEPYGGGHQGPRDSVQFVATKSLGRSRQAPRVGIEIAWTRSFRVRPDERPKRWMVGMVSSHLIGPRTALVADVVRQQQTRQRRLSSFVDIGFNHILEPAVTISGGLGGGVASDRGAVRVFIGLKWTSGVIFQGL
ncbi:hypothetical protein [Komagataeibacter europaeus]|uniref:hypothetical protein n=1 Tax=Komagataeibacter europaeus TaxID=33995 RepID=UPI001E64C809|nr:hypothetical protein [Komagataeibacter europaeus]